MHADMEIHSAAKLNMPHLRCDCGTGARSALNSRLCSMSASTSGALAARPETVISGFCWRDRSRSLLPRRKSGVRVLNSVQPRVREHVRSDAVGHVLLGIAHSGAQFYEQPRAATIDASGDVRIERPIHASQQRFPVPVIPILRNLDVVLSQVGSHAVHGTLILGGLV